MADEVDLRERSRPVRGETADGLFENSPQRLCRLPPVNRHDAGIGTVSPRSLPTTLAAQEKADHVSFARKRLSETNIS